jgi:hypothetical protein
MIKPFLALIFCVFSFGIINAQTVDINGKVIGKSDVDGIHVINKSSQKFTITNSKGEFLIPAKLYDTIVFSGVTYQPKELIITSAIIKSKSVTIELSELVNELDEVVVGKVLTGDLLTDINESGAKAKINFYDLGIPGYTGVPKTQVERKLYEADGGSFINSVGSANIGVGAGVNLHKILNRISGRTKMLKSHVKFEKANTCMDEAITKFADDLFENETLKDHEMIDFFYFASDDNVFLQLCKSKNDLQIYVFLQEKLKVYKANLSETKN